MDAPAAAPGRLLWRCRRGMKELDVILERFARQAWPEATPAVRAAFERLLALPDPLLADCLLGGEHPEDPELKALAACIRDLCHPCRYAELLQEVTVYQARDTAALPHRLEGAHERRRE